MWLMRYYSSSEPPSTRPKKLSVACLSYCPADAFLEQITSIARQLEGYELILTLTIILTQNTLSTISRDAKWISREKSAKY
jgi:hypothetical protein